MRGQKPSVRSTKCTSDHSLRPQERWRGNCYWSVVNQVFGRYLDTDHEHSYNASSTVRTVRCTSSAAVRSGRQVMINYTDHITLADAGHHQPRADLGHIDMARLLVFARFGRSDAEGAYATCHAISLPTSEPSYYFWSDRQTGEMTRRSEWFITKSPMVERGSASIDYLISFCLPRFCDQTIERAHKQESYPGAEQWVAKLDTIVHELYHVDPSMQGIRKLPSTNGRSTTRTHSPEFFDDVIDMTNRYLAVTARSGVIGVLEIRLRGTHQTVRPGNGHRVSILPVISAALCRGADGSAGRRAGRPHRADAHSGRSRALYGRRSRRPRVRQPGVATGGPARAAAAARSAAARRLDHSSSTGDALSPIARRQAVDPDCPARIGGMHEPIAANHDADVRHRAPLGREEHEVPGLEIVEPDAPADLKLIAHHTRHCDAVLREHVLHKTAAIEALQIRAAGPIRNPLKLQRCARDLIAVAMPAPFWKRR